MDPCKIFEVMLINLEPVIQNEVNQKKKNKYHILMHIYGIYKNGADVPICRAGIETQRDLWTQEEKEFLISS